LAVGGYILYLSTWGSPLSERIVIDKVSETIELEKHYMLKQEKELVTFDEISHVEYKERIHDDGTGGDAIRAIVTIVTRSEGEVKVSSGRRGPQYELARVISDYTGKPLEE